jgi:hypothetical protein
MHLPICLPCDQQQIEEMLSPLGSPAAITAIGVRPLALRHTLSDVLPFSSDDPFNVTTTRLSFGPSVYSCIYISSLTMNIIQKTFLHFGSNAFRPQLPPSLKNEA